MLARHGAGADPGRQIEAERRRSGFAAALTVIPSVSGRDGEDEMV